MMSDLIFLYVGYTVIWAGVFFYVLKLHQSQKKLKRELKMLKEVIDGRRERRKKNI